MKMQVYELREGMVTSVGTVQDITQHVEDSRVTHYGVRFQDGWELEYPTDVAFKVTHVPAKHVKRGMRLVGYGEVIGTFVTSNPDFTGVSFANGKYARLLRDILLTLAPVPPVREAPLDPKKHLLWAIDNKDWAQARAALTVLEKHE